MGTPEIQNINIYLPLFARPVPPLCPKEMLLCLGHTICIITKQAPHPIEIYIIYFTAAMGDEKLNHNFKYFHKG